MQPSRIDSTNAIWAKVAGADEVRALYGYYPTMHDAHLLRVEIDGNARSVTITFYYYDLPADESPSDEEETDLHTRIVMRWNGVRELSHRFQDNWIDTLRFAMKGGLIDTTIGEFGTGTDGHIVAESVEVLEVEQLSEGWADDARNETDAAWVVFRS